MPESVTKVGGDCFIRRGKEGSEFRVSGSELLIVILFAVNCLLPTAYRQQPTAYCLLLLSLKLRQAGGFRFILIVRLNFLLLTANSLPPTAYSCFR